MSRAAVVIPNWNSLGYLKRCLASLRDQLPELELMVVDNGSADGSVEWLREEEIPHIALPTNLGFSLAVNRGIAGTKAPAVLVLNADAMLAPGCLAHLTSALGDDPELGGVQPLILQGEPPDPQLSAEAVTEPAAETLTEVYSAGQALTRDGRAYEIGMGEPLSLFNLERREVFGVCGAACLLRRSLLERLGGYDESYFAFCEDVDLNVRGRIHGWRFELVPEARTWHVGNAVWRTAFKRPQAENARLVARNRLATQIKFLPFTALPLMFAVEAGSLLRALRQRRLRATLRGKLQALRAVRRLIGERRRLAGSGDLAGARRWLGRGAR